MSGQPAPTAVTRPALDPRIDAELMTLHLPHARQAAADILATARAQRWEPTEVINAVLQVEVDGRAEGSMHRRLKAAHLPADKTWETFDPALSSIPVPTLDFLATCEWVGRRENLVVCGPSGTGKTHLCQALAHKVIAGGGRAVWVSMEDVADLVTAHRLDNTVDRRIRRLCATDLVVIDDIGLLPMSEAGAEGLYRITDACYERTAMAISSNIHPSGFDQLMAKTLATATVDRLLHHAHLCQTSGDSIRMSQALARQGATTMP